MNLGWLVILTTAVPPLSPTDELKTLRLADPDLVVELVAAEPTVVSPVAMAWDADGRLFVVEMTDYPRDGSGGRVKLLEDKDGDGVYERATIFADGLQYPNGVLPWRGGVLVTAAPDIWYFKDVDGDGKADVHEVVLSGFGTGNQQLRVNGLYWGLDNWVYGANGRSDGDLYFPGSKERVPLRRRDFRFRPDLKKVDPVAGFSQFGLAHDDWGERFPSWNTVPWRHVVIEDEPLTRLAAINTTGAVADILDPSDGGRVFGLATMPERFNRESAAYFNATCGTHLYRGTGLGEAYAGDGFVCESLSNLIHRRKIVPNGSTFIARRVEAGAEFLASTDPWFHPVFLADGPDGALYVADFYRKWVEHPDFTPEEARKRVDFREGWNHGRIWRIRRRDFEGPAAPKFEGATAAELVAQLSSSIGWRRDTAQRLLVERQDRSVVPLLESLVEQGGPLACVHALWTIAGLNTLRDETIRNALGHAHPGVRRNVAKLAAERQALLPSLRKLAHDADPKVQLQTALALRHDDSAEAVTALVDLAALADDDGRRLAIVAAVASRPVAFFEAWHLSRHALDSSEKTRRLHHDLGVVAGASGVDADVSTGLGIAARARSDGVALVLGLSEGLARTGKPLAKRRESLANAKLLMQFEQWAVATAVDSKAAVNDRADAFTLLATLRPAAVGAAATSILGGSAPIEVQRSAARALGRVADRPSLQNALERWEVLPLVIRRELAWACAASEPGARTLLAGVERKHIPSAEVEPALADLLRAHRNPEVRSLAAKTLPRAAADRSRIVGQFQSVLNLVGDAGRGKQAFEKHCRTCHLFRGDGQRVGPDLSGIAGRPRAALLVDILDPNREVSGDFTAVVAALKDGRSATGILTSETAAHIVLLRPDGVVESISRSELESLRSTGKSLMPEGFERNLTPMDLADLLAFLGSAAESLPASGSREGAGAAGSH